MHYFPDFTACFSLFPVGLLFGFYWTKTEYDSTKTPNIEIEHWYSLVSIATCVLVAAILTVKKVREKRYKFDQFYVIFYGIVCYVISACFLINGHSEAAFYFGYAGQGIILIPSYTYISIRTGHAKFRHVRVALANLFFFGGMATGCNTFGSSSFGGDMSMVLTQAENGWMLLGFSITAILFIILNEIFQLTKAYNYKKSRDSEWNSFNESLTLFHNQTIVRKEHQIGQWSLFKLEDSKQTTTVIMLFITLIERVMFYAITLHFIANISFWSLAEDSMVLNFKASYVFYACGGFLGCILFALSNPKLNHLIFSLIKITSMVAILAIYSPTSLNSTAVFFIFYFMAMGVYSSIPYCSILETTPFKYTEVVFGFMYVVETVLLESLKYEVRGYKISTIVGNDIIPDVWTNLLSLGISFSLVSIITAIIVQMYLPKSRGLIEMRADLIGIRKANFIPRPKLWNFSWSQGQNRLSSASNMYPSRPSSNIHIGSRTFQQHSIAPSSDKY